MIVTQIRGGLGNQFFTYAMAYALAREFNVEIELDDYRYATSYVLRDFKLLDYNISYRKLFIENKPKQNSVSHFFYKIWNRLKRKFIYRSLDIDEIEEFVLQKININKKKNYYIKGYWQVHEYFDKYRDELKKEFSLIELRSNILSRAEQIEKQNCCAIHVRHGDYATFKGGKCLDFSYYLDAIDRISLINSNMKFLIFSDDIEYCKKMFSFLDSVEFISSEDITDEEELYLMSRCDNFILANSSFSWWAAYLSNKENSIVICPVVDMWKESFYLDDWIKVSAKISSAS